jgi:hypothetical protein
VLKPKKQICENPHFLSVFSDKPKFVTEKARAIADKEVSDKKFADARKPHDFVKYYNLEHKKVPLAQKFKDTHNKVNGPSKDNSQFLK